MTPAPRLLTEAQLAAYVGLSRATVNRMYHEGELPRPLRRRRPRRWSVAAVERWLEDGGARVRR